MCMRIRYAHHIQDQLQDLKPDILHAHFISDAGWIGAWTGFHPFIVTAHGSDALIHPGEMKPYRFGNSVVMKRADHVVMVAPHLKPHLIRLGCSEEKLHFVPNYADENFIIAEKELSAKFRDVGKNLRIISTRKLSPVYNVETLIRAATHIVRSYPHAEIFILDTGEELQKLEHLVSELKLEHNIHFLGKISHDALASHLKSAHFYVSTALSDGMSVATLEGIASGCYPVLTDIPANRILFNQGFSGAQFECRNHHGLAKGIFNHMESPDRLLADVQKNVQQIQQSFSRQSVLTCMESIYRTVLNRN